MSRRKLVGEEKGSYPDVGLIGCGYAGVQHIEFVEAASTEARFRTICDVRDDAIAEAKRVAEETGVLSTDVNVETDATEIDYGALDGVIIATPHRYHCEQILTALENDTNVLVEKPIAVTVAEGERIRSALERSKGELLVSYQKRHRPRYRTAKRLIEEGAIGDVESISAKRVKYTESPYGIDWRADESVAGGGQLFDIGNHMLDMLLWLTERTPSSCQGVLASREGANMEVYANVIGRLEGDVPYSFTLHAYGDPSIEEFYVTGSDGSLEVTKSGVVLYDGDPEGRAVEGDVGEFHGPTDQFLAALVGDGTIPSDVDRWTESVKTTHKIYERSEKK